MEKDERTHDHYTLSIKPPTGEDPQEDRKSPFPTKSRDGLTPTNTSQRLTFCALANTKPAGDALESTPLQPTDQRYQLYKLRWNISNCDVIRLSPPFFYFSDHLAISKSRSRNYKLNQTNQFIELKILLVSMLFYIYLKKPVFIIIELFSRAYRLIFKLLLTRVESDTDSYSCEMFICQTLTSVSSLCTLPH